MNLGKKQLSIFLIVVYIICTFYMIYTSFGISDDLVYDQGALNISNLTEAEPVFLKLNIVTILYGLIGMAVVVFLFSNRTEDFIYIEKKDKKSDSSDTETDEESDSLKLDKVKKALNSRSADKNLLINKTLEALCKTLEAGMGAFYLASFDDKKGSLKMNSTYAMSIGESDMPTFEFGEGLAGQAASEDKMLIIDDVPDGYMKIVSGLGSASPKYLMIAPVHKKDQVFGVIEIASFTPFEKTHRNFVERSIKMLSEKLNGPAKKEGVKSDEGKKENKKK